MPTSKPRVNVTFSESEAAIMDAICKKRKISMSGLIRKVMEDWLEEYEDMFFNSRISFMRSRKIINFMR